jgi:hypothetical protein
MKLGTGTRLFRSSNVGVRALITPGQGQRVFLLSEDVEYGSTGLQLNPEADKNQVSIDSKPGPRASPSISRTQPINCRSATVIGGSARQLL